MDLGYKVYACLCVEVEVVSFRSLPTRPFLKQEEVRNEGIKQDVRCHAAAEPSTRHPESSLVLQTA